MVMVSEEMSVYIYGCTRLFDTRVSMSDGRLCLDPGNSPAL